jgi:hypothetical protein
MTGTGRGLDLVDRTAAAGLDVATAASQATLDDPAATKADRLAVLEYEAAVFAAYEQRPGAEAELQAAAELEAGL